MKIFNSPGADTHKHTPILTSRTKAISRNRKQDNSGGKAIFRRSKIPPFIPPRKIPYLSLNKCKALSETLTWQLGATSEMRLVKGAIKCVWVIGPVQLLGEFKDCSMCSHTKSRLIAIRRKSDEMKAGTIWLGIILQTHLYETDLTLYLVMKISIDSTKDLINVTKFAKINHIHANYT